MMYLTPVYLTLMHAFKARADMMLERYGYLYNNIDLLGQYSTLRLDGGRQSGKTEAVAEFASYWIQDGGSVIAISDKSQCAQESVRSIKKKYFSHNYHSRDCEKDFDRQCFTETIRSFLDGGGAKCRGRKLNRILYIIDEPMKVPELKKFYEAHFKGPFHATCQQTDKLPLFFVIGMQ